MVRPGRRPFIPWLTILNAGMLLITVAYGLRVLLWSCNGQFKGRASISWVMVGATLAMFVISTIEMALKIRNDLDAFVDYKGLGGATGAFLDVSDWIQVARTAGYNLQTSIGDGIMVYRCYVVYDRNWRIIVVPVLLWLVTTACGWMALYMEATFGTAERLVPFVTPFLALTLALTTMTTGMVVYRILDINADLVSHNVSRVGGGPKLTRIVRILIECGALYTISVVILLCTFLGSKNALSDVWVRPFCPITQCIIADTVLS
ncbi:hypothetical protein L227DRAFT_631433 [Lentinus tigrinus ALCF2SS1-6]|uniref:Uncharacterized protein n=1 Tax=Lentinus tigrinus ALCF2SS1-6 TaxID=1328759 RepID=A0A5C2SQV0_9APHY|nr:hypothetical protein L227DRAFT_631433 [Lentinus tigrinus ALCF2SS1-6]